MSYEFDLDPWEGQESFLSEISDEPSYRVAFFDRTELTIGYGHKYGEFSYNGRPLFPERLTGFGRLSPDFPYDVFWLLGPPLGGIQSLGYRATGPLGDPLSR